MSALQAFVQELDHEAGTTRRILERVPANRLDWRPHSKSMTLGQLALHVAGVPGSVSDMAAVDVFDASSVSFQSPQPESHAQILEALDTSVKKAAAYLSGVDGDAAQASWSLKMHGKDIMAMPRSMLLRSILLNHWYHHRGQLSVYLRLLDVNLPSVYGPTADENPFAG